MARHPVLSSRRVPRVQRSGEAPGGTSPIWPIFSGVPTKLLGGHYSPNSVVVVVVFSESSRNRPRTPCLDERLPRGRAIGKPSWRTRRSSARRSPILGWSVPLRRPCRHVLRPLRLVASPSAMPFPPKNETGHPITSGVAGCATGSARPSRHPSMRAGFVASPHVQFFVLRVS
jgi:hypothetical protein